MVPCFAGLNIAPQPVKVTGWLLFMSVFMRTAFFTSDSFVLIVTLILGSHLIFFIRNIRIFVLDLISQGLWELLVSGGGGGVVTCICRDTGMCHYVGYFFGLLPDFWVPFWAIPGFLNIIFWLLPDFWVSFFGKI